jgi:hypothetical protein
MAAIVAELFLFLFIYFPISYLRTRSVRPTTKTILGAVLAVVGLNLLLFLIYGDPPSPESQTEDAMFDAESRVQSYFAQRHRLPENLSDVPRIPDHADRDVDGWGSPLVYSPQSDGSVVITSLGKEGANNKQSVRFSIIPAGDKADEDAWEMTYRWMTYVENAVGSYAAKFQQLPDRLDLIAPAFTMDGWGRPIEYAPQPDGSVILTSHGATGSGQIFSLQFTVPGATPVGASATATEPSDTNKGR